MSANRVVIGDRDAIPDIFWAVKVGHYGEVVERYVDEEAILLNLEAGFDIPGVHLEYGDSDDD